MKTIYKQSLIIFLLVVMIVTIVNMIDRQNYRNNSVIIPLSNTHIDASFVSPEYVKDIKNTPEDINRYKNSRLLDTNNFLDVEEDMDINAPFIETFESGSNISSS